ncbi:hypothetical protein BG000_001311, partial [Podila horticola]
LEDLRSATRPQSQPWGTCRDRPVIEGLCSAIGYSLLKRRIFWKELFDLTDCYQLDKPREFCTVKIVASLDKSEAVDILFEFAYRHSDLKEQVLSYLSSSVNDFDYEDLDPFHGLQGSPQGLLVAYQDLEAHKDL